MNDTHRDSVAAWIVRGAFVVLALVVFAFSIWNTFSLLGLFLPGDVTRQALGTALFDFGMVVWFGVFVYASHGVGQRGTALTAGILHAGGVVAANYFYLLLGGQTLVQVGGDMAAWALRVIDAALIVELSAGLLHFLLNPAITERMRAQARHDRVMRQAGDAADRKVDEVAADVADQIAEDMRRSALRQLAALTSSRSLVIDGTARELPAGKAVKVEAEEPPAKARGIRDAIRDAVDRVAQPADAAPVTALAHEVEAPRKRKAKAAPEDADAEEDAPGKA